MKALTGQSPARVSAKQDAIYSQLADILTRPQGQSQAIFQALQGLGKSDQATKLMSDRIVRALSGRGLSYPLTTLSQNRLQDQ